MSLIIIYVVMHSTGSFFTEFLYVRRCANQLVLRISCPIYTSVVRSQLLKTSCFYPMGHTGTSTSLNESAVFSSVFNEVLSGNTATQQYCELFQRLVHEALCDGINQVSGNNGYVIVPCEDITIISIKTVNGTKQEVKSGITTATLSGLSKAGPRTTRELEDAQPGQKQDSEDHFRKLQGSVVAAVAATTAAPSGPADELFIEYDIKFGTRTYYDAVAAQLHLLPSAQAVSDFNTPSVAAKKTGVKLSQEYVTVDETSVGKVILAVHGAVRVSVSD